MNIKHLTYGIFATAAIALLGGCASEPDPVEAPLGPDQSGSKTCRLILNVSKSPYDASRADGDDVAYSWKEGDKIFLTFTNGTETTSGEAKYSAGEWSVSYYGELAVGVASKCNAVYVDYNVQPDADDSTSSAFVALSPFDGIYEDQNGQYAFSGSTLTVTADLKPKTGRMRFAGEKGEAVKVNGIATYSIYDCLNSSFTKSSNNAISLKIGNDGYTPYVYGEFINPAKPRMNIGLATTGFTRILPVDIFKPGESGFITIPTPESHNTWREALIFDINDVEMVMLPVYNKNTETLFYLAETELTEEQYAAFTPGVTTGRKSKLPKTGDNGYSTILSNLKNATGISFRIPLYDEWKFAFNGGVSTNPFQYAGSDNLDFVAWYSENSDNKLHEVKKLQPNALGFYDMSGNVYEYCRYSASSSSYYWYGGAFNIYNLSYLGGTSYNSAYQTTNCGYRFALDF